MFRCRMMAHVSRTSARPRPQRHQRPVRLTVGSRRSPDLHPFTNSLPLCHQNPSAGCPITSQVRPAAPRTHSRSRVIWRVSNFFFSLLSRRRPHQVTVHVHQAVPPSTFKEAPDLCPCEHHGAVPAGLPEVSRPFQPPPCGRALAAVRTAAPPPPSTQPDHRGTKQNPGPHHAEVWEVKLRLTHAELRQQTGEQDEAGSLEKTFKIKLINLHITTI